MPQDVGVVPLAGSIVPQIRGTVVGPAPDLTMRVTVVLRSRMNPAEIVSRVTALSMQIPRQRTYLEDPEFTQLCGADPAHIKIVEDFAAANGLQVEESSATRRSVVLSGSLEAIEKAFHVTLQEYVETVVNVGHSENVYYVSHTGPVFLPPPLVGIVESVLGLKTDPPHRQAGVLTGGNGFVTPAQVASVYQFPAGFDGSGQTIGIIEPGCGLELDAVLRHFAESGLPRPDITLTSVFGGQNQPCPTKDVELVIGALAGTRTLSPKEMPSFLAGMNTIESNMDAILTASFAPKAKVVVYAAPDDTQGTFHALAHASTDPGHPQVLSCSWSKHEDEYSPAVLDTLNTVFALAALRGVTICFSSGDDGDGTLWGQSTTPVTHFPSSSPWVLACGGTSLLNPVDTFTEVSWSEAAGKFRMASGGGFSAFNARPAWQTGIPGLATGRGVPDVAGKADVNGGYEMEASGVVFTMGGTSAAAPLWAAITAVLNQALGAPAGLFAPLLYGASCQKTFRQILTSNNGAYCAGPGWNPVTGWGSPHVAALLGVLCGNKVSAAGGPE